VEGVVVEVHLLSTARQADLVVAVLVTQAEVQAQVALQRKLDQMLLLFMETLVEQVAQTAHA
jgi:hypothetical protein